MAADNRNVVSFRHFETPFADETLNYGTESEVGGKGLTNLERDFENPFFSSYDTYASKDGASQLRSEQFVDVLAELHDQEFSNSLQNLASELEQHILPKLSHEAGDSDQYFRNVQDRAVAYLAPLENHIATSMDRISSYMSNPTPGVSLESYLDELQAESTNLTPIQEQFLGGLISKVKSVASKVKDVAMKFSPIQIALNRIKGLVRPLLNRVLNSLIGRLPERLQPIAQSLSKKFLQKETNGDIYSEGNEVLATADFDGIQREFDMLIANFAFDDHEGENLLSAYEYEGGPDLAEASQNVPTLDEARYQFVQRLKAGETAEPVVEQFVPAVMGALKIGVKLVGRQRVVNFLSGLLAKLINKWVPKDSARPLATSIVDLGMKSINLETNEQGQEDLGYEALASTLEEVITSVGTDPEVNRIDASTDAAAFELLTELALPAFNKAAANNFPGNWLKVGLQATKESDVWVLLPRGKKKKMYKKYTRIFQVSLTPQVRDSVKTFGGTTLGQYLKDTRTIKDGETVQGRIHLYEAISGTLLSQIASQEKVPGLGTTASNASSQFHPLTVHAATALLGEPKLGIDGQNATVGNAARIKIGQRFYYLELNGAGVRRPRNGSANGSREKGSRLPRTNDVHATINFSKSEVTLAYYFSEVSASRMVERLNGNDWMGVAAELRSNLSSFLNPLLHGNISSKVKIVHESMPELYLENLPETEEFLGSATKGLLENVVKKLTSKFSDSGYDTIKQFFKSRSEEFKTALAKPEDGVTLKLKWKGITGMSQIKTLINMVRGQFSLSDLKFPTIQSITTPELGVVPGKSFN